VPKNDKRVQVTLACEVCKRRNYITVKNKNNDRERIEMKTVSYTHLSEWETN